MKLSAESRIDFLFVGLFLLLAMAYTVWSWNHELAGMATDNSVYLLTAQYFSPWDTSSDIAKHFAQNSQYPPLYPFVLGLFGGGANALAAHLTTTFSLLLSFIALRAWLLSLGLNRITANMTVLLFALMPGTVKLSMFILSENQYLLFTLLALIAASHYEKKNKCRYLYISVFMIIMATLTRTVGITLAAAFFLYLIFWRPRGAMLMGIMTASPVFILLLLKKIGAAGQGTSYLQDFIARYRHNPLSQLVDQVTIESKALWKGWFVNFEPAALSFIFTLFLIFCLLGLFIGLYRRRLDSYYLLFYFIVILVWPYPAEAKRLMYVVLPVIFVQGILLMHELSRLVAGRKLLQPAPVFLLLLLIFSLPGTLLIIGRFFQPLPDDLEKFRRNKYFYLTDPNAAIAQTINAKVLFEDLRSLDTSLPPNAIIYGITPSFIAYHAKRMSLKPPGPDTDWNVFLSNAAAPDTTYFYMMGAITPSVKTPYYPLELIKNRLKILNIAKTYEASNAPVVAVLARAKDN